MKIRKQMTTAHTHTHTHTRARARADAHTHTCSYRCREFTGNNLFAVILSASAFNSCMFEFSIPDFNETNIVLSHHF